MPNQYALVIEDEPSIRRTVAIFLRGIGFETLTAPDAPSARRLLEYIRPDVIIADERLPGETGHALIDDLRERPELAPTPVVLMSAYGEPADHRADEFLAKPFDPDLLELAIRRHLPENGK
ncbi:MAG TPA: response regulator [Dehalococcoidia bacterium]|nr:response regulator [Dehalococcoidia bacterium]